MHRTRLSMLLCIGMLSALVACEARVTPPASTAASPTSSSTAVPPIGTSTAKPIGEHVIAEWTVDNPSGVFIGFGSVWVPGHHDRTTTRIDPASNTVIAVVQGTGFHSEEALEVGDVLWVTGQQNDTTWIDPKTNTAPASAPRVPGQLHNIAYGFDSVWITTAGNVLDRIDPATGKIISSTRYEDGVADCQGFVAATATAVWVEECDTAELIKIDPATNGVVSKTPYATLIAQAQAQPTLAAGRGTDSIWICIPQDQLKSDSSYAQGLLRVDPNHASGLAFLPLTPEQAGSGYIAVTDESVWLGGSGQINRVNVVTNRVDATYLTDPGTIIQVAFGFGSVWLENYSKNLVQRLDAAP